MPARHRTHRHASLKRGFDDPRLVVERPAPPPFGIFQELDPHHPDPPTLTPALRSGFSAERDALDRGPHRRRTVQFTHVAVDGTKLKASASRPKAMSYRRMKKSEPALAAEVEAWLDRARETDAAEDGALGADRRGDETPDWMAWKQRRLETIRVAKAALEAEAADSPDPEDESGPGASSGMRWQGRPLRGEDDGPPDRAQRNFTDPDSPILPTRDGFVQGYNGQITVDASHQVIVAHRLVTISPSTTARRSTLRLPPPRLAGEISGATSAHSSSVRSLG